MVPAVLRRLARPAVWPFAAVLAGSLWFLPLALLPLALVAWVILPIAMLEVMLAPRGDLRTAWRALRRSAETRLGPWVRFAMLYGLLTAVVSGAAGLLLLLPVALTGRPELVVDWLGVPVALAVGGFSGRWLLGPVLLAATTADSATDAFEWSSAAARSVRLPTTLAGMLLVLGSRVDVGHPVVAAVLATVTFVVVGALVTSAYERAYVDWLRVAAPQGSPAEAPG